VACSKFREQFSSKPRAGNYKYLVGNYKYLVSVSSPGWLFRVKGKLGVLVPHTKNKMRGSTILGFRE